MKLIKEDVTLTEAPAIFNKIGKAVKAGAQKLKNATTNFLDNQHQQRIADKGYNKRDLDSMSDEDLINNIEEGEGYSGNNAILIDAYLDRLTEKLGKKPLNTQLKTIFGNTIATLGTDSNIMLTFLENYLSRVSENLTPEFANTVYSLWADDKLKDDDLSNETSFIYDNRLYNGTDEENLYKLKSLIFINEPKNIKNFGLYKKDNNGRTTNQPITENDLMPLSAQEIEQFLNASQTKNKNDDTSTVFGQYMKDNNITPQIAYNYFYNILKQKYRGTALSTRAQSLKQILTTPQYTNDFKQYRLMDDSANGVVTALNDYIMNFRKTHRGQLGTTRNRQHRADSKEALVAEVVDWLVSQLGEANRDKLTRAVNGAYKQGMSLNDLASATVASAFPNSQQRQ